VASCFASDKNKVRSWGGKLVASWFASDEIKGVKNWGHPSFFGKRKKWWHPLLVYR